MADGIPGVVPIRDSKNPDAPALTFPAGSWTSFIASLKTSPGL
ncbi:MULTISPECIES: DUF397 domain-containing protein [unclassified Streptomyces]